MVYKALTIGLTDELLPDLKMLIIQNQSAICFTESFTAQEASHLLNHQMFHLLIIDLDYLRSIQQTDWLTRIRHNSFVPVIILSNTPEKDINGMVQLGADMCISRKWPLPMIADLAYAQLRRYTEYNHYCDPGVAEISAFQVGDIFIDPARHKVEVCGQPVSLSAKNGWYDEQGRVYIYYTLDEIQEDLNCGHDKATKMLVELDNGKNGFGLIERVRQGQGRPTKIYVKRFTTCTVPSPPPEPAPEPSPRPRLFSGQDCGKAAAQSAEKPQSRLRGSRSQDCGKVAPSYIKSNQTDFSYTDPSILPSGSPPGMGWMDRLEQRREVDEAIGYCDV